MCEPQDRDRVTRKRNLYVAIDRGSRFVHLAVTDDETTASAVAFLEEALTALPFRVTQVLTDRSSGFTAEGFENACWLHGVEHRTTRPHDRHGRALQRPGAARGAGQRSPATGISRPSWPASTWPIAAAGSVCSKGARPTGGCASAWRRNPSWPTRSPRRPTRTLSPMRPGSLRPPRRFRIQTAARHHTILCMPLALASARRPVLSPRRRNGQRTKRDLRNLRDLQDRPARSQEKSAACWGIV
nr:DDE-type integrase/transposase/recombinase [Methylobacterium nodulans]